MGVSIILQFYRSVHLRQKSFSGGKKREENCNIRRNASRSDILTLLRDSWKYKPRIFVSSSAKRITTKFNNCKIKWKKRSCFKRLYLWYDPFSANSCYMLTVSDCSRLRMKTLEQHQCCRSGIFIVNCEHISHFVLVVDFELANICWVYIEKTNTLRSSSQEMFCEKDVLRNFTKSTGKHLCQSLFFNNVSDLKVNNKDTRTTPLASFRYLYC